MQKPTTVQELTDLGRVRLSEHFFMREMLYSEVANFHGIPNIPEDPDLAIETGKRLCQEILEPLYRTFGHVTVRSAYRSPEVNAYCNRRYVESGKSDTGYFCSDNTYNAARHIWDRRDTDGFIGATVSLVIPWYLPHFEKSGDARPLAWWIKDHVPAYAELIFFPWLCAFNIRWYEGPSTQAIFLDNNKEDRLLSDNTQPNYREDHRDLYDFFPPLQEA